MFVYEVIVSCVLKMVIGSCVKFRVLIFTVVMLFVFVFFF